MERLRVLQAASSLKSWGGIERYVVYLSQGLDSQNIDNSVACPEGSAVAKHLPGKAIPISLNGKVSPVAIGKYIKVLRQGKFDVVHAHFSPDFVPVGVAARMSRTPLRIFTRHVALEMSKAKIKRNLALFEHIIPVSDAVMKVLKASGVPPHRMTVAKAGVPPLEPVKSRESVRDSLGVAEEEFAVGSFGRLVKEKGVDVLLDAAALVSGVKFHIFGDGPERATLQRSIADRKLGQKVKLHGSVDDVVDLMNAMDAVAIPSVWAEAFPYAALEAMSIGIPVIASKIGGLPELVRDGVDGLLSPPRDIEALVTNILILRANRSLSQGLGETGKEIHRARYTVEKMGERVANVYKHELGFKGYVFELPRSA